MATSFGEKRSHPSASCRCSKVPRREDFFGAIRSRPRVVTSSARAALSRGVELRRIVVLPRPARRDARADDARDAASRLVVRAHHDARLGRRRHCRLCDRLVRARCGRAVAPASRLLGSVHRGDGALRDVGVHRGAHRGLLADSLQDLHDRGRCAQLLLAVVRCCLLRRPWRALFPGRRPRDLGRRGGGASSEAPYRHDRMDHGRGHRRRGRDLRVAMRAAAVALVLLTAGCVGSSSSIVDYPARVHIVQPGETLYGIAWRYGVDYRDLARWNRIDDPNFIRVGQRILLTPPASDTTAASAGTGNAARPASQPASTSATRSPGSAATRPRTASTPPRTAGTPSSGSTTRSPSATTPSSTTTPMPTSPPPRWHWPTSGQV